MDRICIRCSAEKYTDLLFPRRLTPAGEQAGRKERKTVKGRQKGRKKERLAASKEGRKV